MSFIPNPDRRGSASVLALFATIVLVGLSGAILTVSMSTSKEGLAAKDRHKAFFVANSGISHAVAELAAGNSGALGDAGDPVSFSDGAYWTTVNDNGDGTFSITSTAAVRRATKAIEAVVQPTVGGLFDHAIFAGNTSGDPLYRLTLGGLGTQADEVRGSVYSGGNVHMWGDASVTGTVRATGVISGGSGESSQPQPVPDLAAPDYAHTADYDVREMFLSGASYTSDDAGGMAWQLPESNPAHIFRANPGDRSREVAMTVKDDFFLEDPYEDVRTDRYQDGTDPYQITLSGSAGEPGESSNRKVFYIDGNLWLHNKKAYSFQFRSPKGEGVQVTFVVRGNVYFSDNLFYDDPQADGVAFIAMKDPEVEDSGNIYFGDPEFGTLRHMQAFMYAEDTFLDVNLDESGSTIVELDGIMSAGDHVSIVRDHGDAHTKLLVNFDDRVATGALSLPGLPPLSGGDGPGYVILTWREVPLL